MKKIKLTLLTTCLGLLTACGNLSDVSPEGTTENPIFPSLDKTTFNHDGTQIGSWVNWENVKQIERGMNKDQLYNLIGRPHFAEGLYGVREWDYVFNYRENGEHKICQYKILFDKNMNAQSFFWHPNGCNGNSSFVIESDFLFDFDKYNITEQGQRTLEELAMNLIAFKSKDVEIIGHTDRMGSNEYNDKLSLNRANAVIERLKELGVKANFIAIGKGEREQVKHCDGEDQKAKDCLRPNRRVEVKSFGKFEEKGNIGPSPLYKPMPPYIQTGNPYPKIPAMNLQK